jgi:hypothetical protein
MSRSSKYLAKQVASFDQMVKLENETQDRHLKRIVTNVRRHVALEVGWERFSEALDPEWMVEDPQYLGTMPSGGRTGHWSGLDQVKSFYDQFKGGDLFTAVNVDVYLAPNGIANTMDIGFYVPGSAIPTLLGPSAEQFKDVVDDPDAMYAVSSYMVSFWPMDERARLKGEEFYHIGDFGVEKMAPEDVFTRQELTEACRPYMNA